MAIHATREIRAGELRTRRSTTSSLWPAALVDECGSLYVCDDLNGRVLVYTKIPTTNGASADVVLVK